MIFSKSIGLHEDDLGAVASAAGISTRSSGVEELFLDKLREGNAEAFDILINRYSADIYALLYRLTEDAEEAGDLTQETFLSALKAIGGFRGDAELKTWLFRIAVNHSRNRFRWWKRRRRHKTISLDDPVGTSEMTVKDTLEGRSPDPEAAALRSERERAIRQALHEMQVIYREVIVLCDIEGLSYEEAARALDINIGTLKSRLARGRDDLRQRLKGF
jgi:RNA polymerase sigma-70 factor, ECF subfamily